MSFLVWVGFTAVHVLGHLPQMWPGRRREPRAHAEIGGLRSGRAGRSIALAGTLVGGLVLAVVLLPQFAAWTHQGAF